MGIKAILLPTIILCGFVVKAQDAVVDSGFVEELQDSEMRENPMFEGVDSSVVSVAYDDYPFLNPQANRISLNGADWSALINKFAASEEHVVNIVHIGDSHIQADMSTSVVRRLLQEDFGSEGRGLIVPLRLAGTNEPSDYAIRTDAKVKSEKLLRYPWDGRMGFTGVCLTPEAKTFSVTVSAKEPFERIRVFYSGDPLNVESVDYRDDNLVFATSENGSALEIGLPFPCEEITIELSTLGAVSIYGLELSGDIIGVAYHAIGINGATCESYNRVDDFGAQISVLDPDLIIISLGTNEAFGRFDQTEFKAQLGRLVNGLKSENPSASLLLVTPAECQRRIRRGRKRRSVSYTVNKNIASVSEAIRSFGEANSIAVYDWLEAAGGEGASSHWLKASLLSRDRVHCSRLGYELSGKMLYDALISILNSEKIVTNDID